MQRLLAFPGTRRGKWIVFFAWIALVFGGMAAGLPAKFSDAKENESTSFLPGDAESTRTLEITERLQKGELAPTVVVYRRAGGLTARDRAEIARDVAELNRITARYDNTTPFGEPEVSRDATTAIVRNQIKGTGEGSGIIDPVQDYREAVSEEGRAPPGLEVKVAGPAGLSADAIEVFEGINSTLLTAAMGLVIFLLILIYRSPVFWFFPILAVGFAEVATRSFGYGLTELGVTVNEQSSSIMSVLVIGAGTDYALLLVARYREELRRHEDRHQAMQIALRRAGPAIIASGLTVSIALLSLMLAKVNGTAGLGPSGALGVTVAILAMVTFLPAVLTIVGRRPFWPFIPYGPEHAVHGRIERRLAARAHRTGETHGLWRRVGEAVAARPRAVGSAGVALLAVMALGLLNFSTGLTSSDTFRDSVESVEGQELIARAFPGGAAAPTDIVVREPGDVERVAAAAARVPGVAGVPPQPVAAGDPGVLLAAFLDFDPYSKAAYDVIPDLREAVRRVAPDALVGGPTAVEVDLRSAAADDTLLLIPSASVIVFLILVVLLRAIVAPVLLILTVVASLLAAVGVGAVVFDVVFGFPGSDPSLPLFAFIFLVALGVDYNIFLMARVREETLKHGTRGGMLRGLAVTGGVITSAGIVLAGTFAVLAVLPLTFLTEIGFVIAFGVLLDTFLVRSVLVPALVFDLGPRIWWPSRLARSPLDRRDLAGVEPQVAGRSVLLEMGDGAGSRDGQHDVAALEKPGKRDL
jgi:RND superfamily putative drug exporter